MAHFIKALTRSMMGANVYIASNMNGVVLFLRLFASGILNRGNRARKIRR